MAEQYNDSALPMYGDALRMPSRKAIIEIIRSFQKLLFPVYYGEKHLLKLPPEQYGALLMVLPFGGFLTLGTLIAIVQAITNRRHNQEIRAGKLSVIAALDAAHGEEVGGDE